MTSKKNKSTYKPISSIPLIHDILNQYWGYPQFRSLQEEIITSILEKKDTLAIMPTGGGKSICFQVPALAMDGVCIVVTPLIALMKDQVEQLRRRGINAASIHSGLSYREIDILLDNAVYGNLKFIYLSPERLHTELFIERFRRMKVALIAVDEAHCISEWGYDFRPAYLEIAKIREVKPEAPVIALTATATEKVRKDIMEKLLFKKENYFIKSFSRENLSYSVFKEEDKERKLVEILSNVAGSAIVYARSRKRTKDIAEFLKRKKISVEYYHAGLSNDERSQRQEFWIQNRSRVMVATNAFGMGIDKPDVRVVVHMDIPDNPESYYQEAGRAGRDEKKCYAVLLYQESDVKELYEKLEMEYPPVEFVKRIYQSLANYYKLAIGSAPMTSYDFDIDHFCEHYKLSRTETFYALKRLEHEGLIELNDAFHHPSRLMMNTNQQELYAFQVANERYDELIKTVLRICGGEIFSHYLSIEEKSLAKKLNFSESEVVKRLTYLHQQGIVLYEPKKDKSQLTFTMARQDAANLPLNVKGIQERKAHDKSKMEVMIRYAQQHERCRSLFLLDYFGEASDQECGKCDVCLTKKKQINANEEHKRFHSKILMILKQAPEAPDGLVRKIGVQYREQIIRLTRAMLEAGEIHYNKEGKLFIK